MTETSDMHELVHNYLKSIISTLPHFNCLEWLIDHIKSQAERFKKFKNVIFLGTGGSSLGGQAVSQLRAKNTPQMHFIDNIDAAVFEKTIDSCQPESTGVVIISKSGNTAETLMQFLTLKALWSSFDWQNQALIVTEDKQNSLRSIAEKLLIPTLEHPADIGGRFSIFTVVGLLPCLIAGLDAKKFRDGAKETLTLVEQSSAQECACIQGAVQSVTFAGQGVMQSVMLTYSNALYVFAAWYAQLWGESLGKINEKGQRFGTTPSRALGAVDQHSQLQLYLDGPRDKFFTVITLKQQHPLPKIDTTDLGDSFLAEFQGKSMGDLMIAEQKATVKTMREKGCIVREMQIEKLDEFALGGLMMHFILETLATAYLWNINPFDQPAVESGKKLALELLHNKNNK
jgi:glucose-6-phosphate isomerase